VRIVVDDLTHPAVVELLGLHLRRMHEQSPPGSVFALDLAGLRAPGVTCFTAWDDVDGGADETVGNGGAGSSGPGELMGCGALKELDASHGEVKSMRTADAFLRRGVAAAVLAHIVDVARARGYRRLSLETGTGPAFEASHRLYERAGFRPCGPFGGYTDTVFSTYFTAEL
jgi:putative acetyltransferase